MHVVETLRDDLAHVVRLQAACYQDLVGRRLLVADGVAPPQPRVVGGQLGEARLAHVRPLQLVDVLVEVGLDEADLLVVVKEARHVPHVYGVAGHARADEVAAGDGPGLVGVHLVEDHARHLPELVVLQDPVQQMLVEDRRQLLVQLQLAEAGHVRHLAGPLSAHQAPEADLPEHHPRAGPVEPLADVELRVLRVAVDVGDEAEAVQGDELRDVPRHLDHDDHAGQRV
mmetsp:Transcript_60677/g.180713  ORF Transcript_60677/g.180713 Transcript_60677/m.180713 type:complete len:228 (+) Transcript_60677:722-1405(+)